MTKCLVLLYKIFQKAIMRSHKKLFHENLKKQKIKSRKK